jgi:hypothetical protein
VERVPERGRRKKRRTTRRRCLPLPLPFPILLTPILLPSRPLPGYMHRTGPHFQSATSSAIRSRLIQLFPHQARRTELPLQRSRGLLLMRTVTSIQRQQTPMHPTPLLSTPIDEITFAAPSSEASPPPFTTSHPVTAELSAPLMQARLPPPSPHSVPLSLTPTTSIPISRVTSPVSRPRSRLVAPLVAAHPRDLRHPRRPCRLEVHLLRRIWGNRQ